MIVAFAAALLAAPRASYADEPFVVTESDTRIGFTAGVGLGVGHLGCAGEHCDGFTEAGGIDFHLGTMLSPRFALLGEVWGMMHRGDRLTLTHSIVTAGARAWIVPRVWIGAGAGVARATWSYDEDFVDFENTSDTVLGFTGGAGVELISTNDFALDAQLRVGTGIYDEDTRLRNVALTIGASFY